MLVVAEISSNHNGSLDRARALIDSLKCDAVKFQTFIPEQMAVPHKLESGLWKGRDLVDLYKEAYTPREWHKPLFNHAKERGLIPFSTPFSKDDVDFLESLDCPMYKIASFEMVDLELIEYTAKTGKPLIMSCGQVNADEIGKAYISAKKYTNDITLLHCVSEYPATDINLKTMEALKHYGCKVGLSDHSLGPTVAIMAATLGASVIEKHVTLSKEGLDKDFSMLPSGFNSMARTCKDVERILGEVKYPNSTPLRRSLYYSTDLEKGSIINKYHIKTARPNLGLSPLRINEVIGTKLKYSVKENEPVQI